MSYNILTDEMLVKLLMASDEKAFKVIYERYWKILYLIAIKKVGSSHIAEELIQALFVNIWEKRNTSKIENLSAYLSQSIKYKIINLFESKYSKQLILDEEVVNSVNENTTENSILLKELNSKINCAIQKLPTKTRKVFELSRFEKFSIREISKELDISEKAVEYHITQSLKFLRMDLKDYMVFSLILGYSASQF